jgi:peptide/nickel transport system ATP-binding protein
MDTLLSIQNLTISFSQNEQKTTAVNNISIDVNKNEIVAIVGESGSGKSVTSLAILQLLSAAITSGNIFFNKDDNEDIDLLKLSQEAINEYRGNAISMIFQEPMTALNPVYTCGQQVIEAILTHQKITKAEARAKTIALFEKVKLPNPSTIINKYPHELSGGQKQRVMIAMAICNKPKLLIADEPTTALDVTVQKSIIELLQELQQQNGMSVILITHDLGLVADVAHKIVVMYKGEIVEQGNAANVLKHPIHWYTKALLACRPAANAKGSRLPVVADFRELAVDSGQSAISNQQLTISNEPAISSLSNHQTVLDVQNLQVHYTLKKKLFTPATIFKAVDDVSFSVKQGEILGLVGESGCGKTTLGRAILQLIPATKGKIILNGVDIAAFSKKQLRQQRKDLQIVFQDPYGSLNPRLTIGEAILEPLQVHSVLQNNNQRKQKVIELLEKVNLQADYFNRYPHQFSGGQRQRICIARALALNPSFLIFDESVSALDVSVQAQVLNLLGDLKNEFGFTAIFISHDLSVVHYISDTIMVMDNGKIVEKGDAHSVFYHPKEKYTQQLIEAIPGKKIA